MKPEPEREWAEDEVIAISALSHYLYCPRQYALIHIEGVFIDNHLTVGGSIGHSTVDRGREYAERGVPCESSMRVYSDELGLSGIADLVEFPEDGPPFPVEYKHGRIKSWTNHEVQLCAIALCIEEMLGVSIAAGAIYHIGSRRRRKVELGETLRRTTRVAIARIRALQTRRELPAPVFGAICRRCSLKPACQPEALAPPADELYQAAALYG